MTHAATTKVTFKHQGDLPRLPVPDLQKSLALYLKTLQPLLTSTQLEESKRIVADFIQPNGLGQRLHERLVARARTAERSWFIDWWNEAAYFGYRDPVVINVNYFFQFVDDPVFKSQVDRAAALIQATLKFRDLILREELAPETVKDTPLDMDQYRYMFNACRRPQPTSDITVTFPAEKHQYITVLRKNRIFAVPVFPNGSTTPFSTAQISRLLQSVIDTAGQHAEQIALGALTTEHRDVWAQSYIELSNAHPNNPKAIEAIESSIFTVCLDDTSPSSRQEIDRALWHGDGRNRWFDKSVQLIVFANGKAGLNGEHSMMDGTPTNRLADFIMENLLKQTINHHGDAAQVSLPSPSEIRLIVPASVQSAISKATARFDADVAGQDHHAERISQCGKARIKAFKISPDAFAQMAIQLAHYRLKGEFVATYESSQTRKFLAGRTEVCRVVSTESVAFVRAMQDRFISKTERLDKLRRAAASHVAYMTEAGEGRGCDRLLLGLKLARQPGEEHAFFKDPALALSSSWRLSTSQISSEYFDGYGWGQVLPNGFGIAYMINQHFMNYNIACRRDYASAAELGAKLQTAIDEMCDLFDSTQLPSSKL